MSKVGFIDYTWAHKESSTLLNIGDYGFQLEDIQEQPIIIRPMYVELYHWGVWKTIDATNMDIDWLRKELTARGVAHE